MHFVFVVTSTTGLFHTFEIYRFAANLSHFFGTPSVSSIGRMASSQNKNIDPTDVSIDYNEWEDIRSLYVMKAK